MILKVIGIDKIIDDYFGGERDFALIIREQINNYFSKNKVYFVGDVFTVKCGHIFRVEIIDTDRVEIFIHVLNQNNIFIRTYGEFKNTCKYMNIDVEPVMKRLFEIKEKQYSEIFETKTKRLSITIGNYVFFFQILNFCEDKYNILEFEGLFEEGILRHFVANGFCLSDNEFHLYENVEDKIYLNGIYYVSDINVLRQYALGSLIGSESCDFNSYDFWGLKNKNLNPYEFYKKSLSMLTVNKL